MVGNTSDWLKWAITLTEWGLSAIIKGLVRLKKNFAVAYTEVKGYNMPLNKFLCKKKKKAVRVLHITIFMSWRAAVAASKHK